jgi:hypothetical protein
VARCHSVSATPGVISLTVRHMNLVAVLALAASTTIPGEPSDAAIEDYVDSLAQADPAVGQALAEPDSPAWWMAMYQSLSTAAIRDAGVEPDPQTATVANGSVEVCYEQETLPCTDLDRFTANADGLIVSFYVEGNDIAPRLGVTSEPVAVGTSAAARVFVSYRMVRPDSLFVLISVSATSTTAFGSPASYVNPNGRQVEMSDSVGPSGSQVFGGAQATFLLTFPSSDPGGRLFWRGEAGDTTAEFELPVPALEQPAEATTQTTVVDGFRRALRVFERI